ncbi:unnamed protein product, partial [Symbiodinium sp. CCMP2592]
SNTISSTWVKKWTKVWGQYRLRKIVDTADAISEIWEWDPALAKTTTVTDEKEENNKKEEKSSEEPKNDE